jgi:NADH:ubiquinone reductase (H+-translocating)
VIVNPDLSVPGTPDVFVIVDLAVILKSDGKPGPGLAGRTARRAQCGACDSGRVFGAVCLHRQGHAADDRPRRSSRGGWTAQASGFVAWIVWLFIHIFYLIGFRNRFMVLAGWAWVYLRNESGA